MLWGDDLKNGLSSEDNKLHNQVNRNEPFTLQHVLAAVKFFHFNSPCSLFHVCDVVSSYISQNSFREIASSYGILLHYITTSQKTQCAACDNIIKHERLLLCILVYQGCCGFQKKNKKKKPGGSKGAMPKCSFSIADIHLKIHRTLKCNECKTSRHFTTAWLVAVCFQLYNKINTMFYIILVYH